MIHQAAHWIGELEKKQGRSGTIVKKMNSKSLLVNGDSVGVSLQGVWQWHSAAHKRYTPEELEDTKLAIDATA